MSFVREPKTFIFDLDGVIIDSEPLHERAMRVACGHYDIPIWDDLFDEFRGQPDRAMLEHIAQQTARAFDVENVLEAKQDTYASLISNLKLVPGARDILEILSQRERPLGLVTSAANSDLDRTFQQFDLARYFTTMITADDVKETKPHPDPYLRAVEQLPASAPECVVIEDSLRGIEAGLAAECMVVGLCTSFSAPALDRAGADHVIMDYDELLELL